MGKEKTILIVEDEYLSGLEIQESLVGQGYHVPEVVSTADMVLPAVMKHKPHLVIMDINLGCFTDGVDAAQRMKLLGDTSILYLTAYGDESTRSRAMGTAPRDYLLKPVSQEQLHQSVAKALIK